MSDNVARIENRFTFEELQQHILDERKRADAAYWKRLEKSTGAKRDEIVAEMGMLAEEIESRRHAGQFGTTLLLILQSELDAFAKKLRIYTPSRTDYLLGWLKNQPGSGVPQFT